MVFELENCIEMIHTPELHTARPIGIVISCYVARERLDLISEEMVNHGLILSWL